MLRRRLLLRSRRPRRRAVGAGAALTPPALFSDRRRLDAHLQPAPTRRRRPDRDLRDADDAIGSSASAPATVGAGRRRATRRPTRTRSTAQERRDRGRPHPRRQQRRRVGQRGGQDPGDLRRRAGNDGLFGGGGRTRSTADGDDNIVARDGRAEAVNCGEGHDTAITDDPDIRVSCEEIEGDADSDGVRRPADCDDTNPLFRPGVTDIPDNGVDEDCNGVDAVNIDRDGDGSPRPQDCDDTNAGDPPGRARSDRQQGRRELRHLIEPFPPLTGSVSGTWARVGKRTENLTLVAKGFPKGTSITLRCIGPELPEGHEAQPRAQLAPGREPARR